MPVGAMRFFEASYSTIEWLVEEKGEELSDDDLDALETTHDILRRYSNEIWDADPPELSEIISERLK